MTTAILQGHRQCVRDFIDTVLEAHYNLGAARPTLAGLVACLTDEEITGPSRDEPLAVAPEFRQPHPTGWLRRDHGSAGVWAHLPDTGCYLHFPDRFAVRYKFEVSGDYAALSLQAAPPLPGFVFSENFVEVPIGRLIIDATLITILVLDHSPHQDVEILVS
jgi:hypothetical protein